MKILGIIQSLAIAIIMVSLLLIYSNYDYTIDTSSSDFGTWSDKTYYVLESASLLILTVIIYLWNKDFNFKTAWLIVSILLTGRFLIEIGAVTIGLRIWMKYAMATIWWLSLAGFLIIMLLPESAKKKWRN